MRVTFEKNSVKELTAKMSEIFPKYEADLGESPEESGLWEIIAENMPEQNIRRFYNLTKALTVLCFDYYADHEFTYDDDTETFCKEDNNRLLNFLLTNFLYYSRHIIPDIEKNEEVRSLMVTWIYHGIETAYLGVAHDISYSVEKVLAPNNN